MSHSNDLAADAPAFGSLPEPQPQYAGVVTTAFYLPMRDGVRIAIDLCLPDPLPPDARIPALITQTRYWREFRLRAPFRWFFDHDRMVPRALNAKYVYTALGYALLKVDVRGTGASGGVYPHPWSVDSFEDAREIVDWIVRQPWSNGRVGGYGTSYGGTSAELLAALDHPAVGVVIPKFNHPDPYADISHPGGLFNQRFIRDWSTFDDTLDQNRLPPVFDLQSRLLLQGVKPVDADRQGKQLRQSLAEHRANGSVYATGSRVTFRDESAPGVSFSMQDFSVHRWKPEIERSATHIYGWGSWFDAGTADAVLRRFLTFERAGQGVIGAWNHGGQYHASPHLPPGAPVSPPLRSQLLEMARIFDLHLKENPPAALARCLHYYTTGEEQWHSTAAWPPEGIVPAGWFFGPDRSLQEALPAEAGRDAYPVDVTTTSGGLNRWWEMNIIQKKTVVYPDFASQSGKTLHYTSAPLERDLEISGYPVVSLHLTCTTPDVQIIVYLLEVDRAGRVTYITEGQLRAIHRKVATEPGPYCVQTPRHSFLAQDALPLTPGEPAELRFGLQPISTLVRAGRQLRVAIAGHDEGTFPPLRQAHLPRLEMLSGPLYPSGIELPSRWR